MFLRINDRIINAAQIVEVEIYEAREAHWDGGEHMSAAPFRVRITTTAFEGGGEDPESGWMLRPRTIVFDGGEAELFLAALPVYTPAFEEEGVR